MAKSPSDNSAPAAVVAAAPNPVPAAMPEAAPSEEDTAKAAADAEAARLEKQKAIDAQIQQKVDEASLENLSLKETFGLTKAELAKLDETDPVAAANIRNQLAWKEQAKELFPGETEEQKRKAKLLQDIQDMDAKNAKEQREAQAKIDAELARANAQARIDALKAKDAELDAQRAANEKEMAELSAMLKG